MSFIINPYRFNVCPAEALAFIAAAGITDATQKQAICTLVTDLKGYGIWTKMKAIYPFVGGTSSTHKWNLKDPRDLDAAFRLVFSGGWTHSSTGALPGGVNGYANTFLTPSTNLTFANTHMSHYSRTNNTTQGVSMGSWNGGSQEFTLWQRHSSLGKLMIHYTYPSGANTASAGTTLGLICGSRTSTSSGKLYFNGVLLNTNTNTSIGTLPTLTIYLGASNNNGQYDNKEIAFASIGDGLTDTEAANLYTAVQAYQTTLGRQV